MPEQDKPKSDQSPTPATYHIDTGGGTVIIGDVEVSGGDFIGRDRIQGEREARVPRIEPTPGPAPSEERPPAPQKQSINVGLLFAASSCLVSKCFLRAIKPL